MANLDAIKEKLGQAHEIQHASTGVYRQWRDKYNEEVSKISANRDLSADGKYKMKELLKKRKTVELMKLSRQQIDEYRKVLSEASKEADKIANAKPAEVDPVKAERFEKSFGELKTAVMLATPEKAISILNEFIDATDEPALVDRIRAEFAAVVAPVIAQARPEQKQNLNDLFEHTRRKAKGPEAIEAEQLKATAEAMQNSGFFGLSVIKAVMEISKEASDYVNKPETFFEKYPEAEKMNTALRSQEEVITEIENQS